MGWSLSIGGIPYSAYSEFQSWTVYRSVRHQGSTAQGTVTIPDKALARPKGFQEVILSHTDGDGIPDYRLFGGIIQRVEQVEVNPNVFEYRLTCSDYTRWLDHIPVRPTTIYDAMTVDLLVKTLVYDWALRDAAGDTQIAGTPGSGALTGVSAVTGQISSLAIDPPNVPISVNHVQAMTYPVYGFVGQDLPLSITIDGLAKEAYAVWFVDEYADLWFAQPNSSWLQAPLALGNVTYFEQTAWGGIPPFGTITRTLPLLDADNDITYRDLKITEDVSNLVSAVAAKNYIEAHTAPKRERPPGHTLPAAGPGEPALVLDNADLVADGSKRWFRLNNRPVNAAHATVNLYNQDASLYKSYTVAGGDLFDEYTIEQPSEPSGSDYCFVDSAAQGLRFNVAPPVAGGNTRWLEVLYNYYIENAWDVDWNPILAATVADREGWGPGYYFGLISGQELNSPLTLAEGLPDWKKAEYRYLNRYSRVKLLASFSTYQAGWRPGQVFGLKSLRRGDTADDPLYNVWGQTFAMRMFVTGIDARIVNDDTVDYHVEACSDIWGE